MINIQAKQIKDSCTIIGDMFPEFIDYFSFSKVPDTDNMYHVTIVTRLCIVYTIKGEVDSVVNRLRNSIPIFSKLQFCPNRYTRKFEAYRQELTDYFRN